MIYYLMAERSIVQFGSLVRLKTAPEELQVVLDVKYYQRMLRLGRLVEHEDSYALVEYLYPHFKADEVGAVHNAHLNEVEIVEALRRAALANGREIGADEIDMFISSFPDQKATSIIITYE